MRFLIQSSFLVLPTVREREAGRRFRMSFVWLTKHGWSSTVWTTLFVAYCFTALPLLVFAAAYLLTD
jgi:hypothetical protein